MRNNSELQIKEKLFESQTILRIVLVALIIGSIHDRVIDIANKPNAQWSRLLKQLPRCGLAMT